MPRITVDIETHGLWIRTPKIFNNEIIPAWVDCWCARRSCGAHARVDCAAVGWVRVPPIGYLDLRTVRGTSAGGAPAVLMTVGWRQDRRGNWCCPQHARGGR